MALTVSYCQHSAKSVQNSAIEVWQHDDVARFESLPSISTKRLYTFPKRQKSANLSIRAFFRRHQLFFCRLYFFKVGIYDVVVFLSRRLGLCALACLCFSLRLSVNHFAQFLAGCTQSFGFGIDIAALSSPLTASSASFNAASIFSFSAASSLSP